MNSANEFPREQLLEANEAAARYYRDQLLGDQAKGPKAYLEARGFAHLLEETPWTVGFAPAGWTHMQDHLLGKGFSREVLLAAGLVSTCRRGTTIDRFRDRITFGIRNLQGDLVGFTGRCSPAADDSVPKYLNTPRTTLYDKGSVLFGLGELGPAIRDGANLVLVEGPLDALAVDLASAEGGARLAPLAACGTAISQRHAELLGRLVQGHVIVAFDRDPAGAKASETACATLSPRVNSLFAATLPNGSDPAQTLVGNGPTMLLQDLLHVQPLTDRIVDDRVAAWPNLDNAEAKVACLREVSHVLTQMSPQTMARQSVRLREQLDLDGDTVTRELAEAVSSVKKHLKTDESARLRSKLNRDRQETRALTDPIGG